MEFRSTNAKFTHHQGDFVTNVEDGSSHGCHLTGGSTGAVYTAAGDEANVAARLTGKGTGPSYLGNSSATARIGVSTSGIDRIQRYLVQYTVPALSSASSGESTVTVSGLTTNSILVLQNRLQLNSTVVGVTHSVRCSTANELTIEFHNISQSSLSGSTQSGYLLQVAF